MTRFNFHHRHFFLAALLLTVALGSALWTRNAFAQTGLPFCTTTAQITFQSCLSDVTGDFFKATAICLNNSNQKEHTECSVEAQAERTAGFQTCGRELTARRDTCKLLGEAPYDPDFDPEDFDGDFTRLTRPNRYVPLKIGNRWEYSEGEETVLIEVLNETKLIDDVTCIVVRDQVFVDGEISEDTDDWFAQAKNGDVWYCGEETKEFQRFAGDHPQKAELVSIDGSFKADRNGDQPGIFFLDSPTPRRAYRQEFSLGNAEDVAQVVSTNYKFGRTPELDQFVPPALAALLCAAGDCVVTKEFSAKNGPQGGVERKYYARGIGVFLETKVNRGIGPQLTNCNFDPRCARLPHP